MQRKLIPGQIYCPRKEARGEDIRLENVPGVFSVTYLPDEMCLITYYTGGAELTRAVSVAYSLRDGSITGDEISDNNPLYRHLGQVLLAFERKVCGVGEILPGFIIGLNRRIQAKKADLSLVNEKKVRAKIIVPPEVRRAVKRRLNERRRQRIEQKLAG
jgi:hypothetical protein